MIETKKIISQLHKIMDENYSSITMTSFIDYNKKIILEESMNIINKNEYSSNLRMIFYELIISFSNHNLISFNILYRTFLVEYAKAIWNKNPFLNEISKTQIRKNVNTFDKAIECIDKLRNDDTYKNYDENAINEFKYWNKKEKEWCLQAWTNNKIPIYDYLNILNELNSFEKLLILNKKRSVFEGIHESKTFANHLAHGEIFFRNVNSKEAFELTKYSYFILTNIIGLIIEYERYYGYCDIFWKSQLFNYDDKSAE